MLVVSDAVDLLSEALDTLVAHGAERYSDAESICVLHQELSRLEALVTEATAAFEASEHWAGEGAKSAAAWIATRCRLPRSVARRRVRLGRTLRQMPTCAEAWRGGRIGADQAQALARARRRRTDAAMGRDEAMLVTYAEAMGFEDFNRALAYWSQLADPQGSEEAEEARRARRDVWLEESLGGIWLGQMTLDPISGTIVATELARLEAALFEADCTEASERLGGRPGLDELARSAAQRRADALVEMATRSAALAPGATRPAPLFSVLVGYETIHGRICELERTGTVIDPSALDPWMEGASFERAIFSLGTRVEVSTRARLFTGGTRRALELRDRRCAHPYCDEPPERCEGDHIDPYADGGETTQDNGRLLCGFHNRLRNQSERKRPPPEHPPAT
jgi:Domain of unknown function (DUF222)/HNH endonuclease